MHDNLMLHVRESAIGGRGVFTDTPIRKGDVIEECPILLLSDADVNAVEQTVIDSYIYYWGRDRFALVFGYGMLYNHGEDPCADARENFHRRIIEVIALRDIAAEEEILIDYTGGENRKIIFTGDTWVYEDTGERV